MTVKRQYVVTQALISLAAASLLGACTTYPWETAMAPAPTYRTSGGAAANGVPAGFYRVNPGDTLHSIAGAFGQRAQDLAAWINAPRLIEAWPELYLPAAVRQAWEDVHPVLAAAGRADS